jgi:hypothetical protein
MQTLITRTFSNIHCILLSIKEAECGLRNKEEPVSVSWARNPTGAHEIRAALIAYNSAEKSYIVSEYLFIFK